MSNTSRIETCEISDADLDSVAGGMDVSGSLEGLTATAMSGPLGTMVDAALQSASVSVTGIPVGGGSINA